MTEVTEYIQKNPNAQLFEDIDPGSKLNEVISELKQASDIEGAMLVNENEEILSCALPDDENFLSEIPGILSLLEEPGEPGDKKLCNTFFTHRIFDYKGLFILAKRLINRLTLLVIIQKRGYISLAMLDVENSTQRILDILKGNQFKSISS